MKGKLALFVAGLALFFSLLYIWLSRVTIARSENHEKQVFITKVISRISQVIQNEKQRMATICFNWAAWDGMYEYAEKPTREFESQSMPAAVIPEYDLNLVVILNKRRQVIYHEGYLRSPLHPIRVMPGKAQNRSFWEALTRSFEHPGVRSHICLTEHGPLILVSAPILHSDARGPMNGRVLMGRLVDAAFNERIGAAIQERTDLLLPGQPAAGLDAGQARRLLDEKFLLKETRNLLRLFIVHGDDSGRPAYIIRVDADGTLFRLQRRAGLIFLHSLLFSLFLVGLLFYFFTERLLLRRLKDISRRTRDITTFEDLSIRIPEKRRDEIAQLSRDINTMLERLENESARQRQMENRLVMNEKLVATGRLAANIAHEINNPLFAISNSIAVIRGQLKDAGGDVGEVLPLAEKEIRRVRKITKKLLDYGKVNLESFQESDIGLILGTAHDVLKLGGQIGRTAVSWKKREKEMPLRCNPDGLQQVFMNLMKNASEAMGGGGQIHIEVERTGDNYAIHFRDTGPGFPALIQQRIFEPFNTSKEEKGAGLGLYISYHIIKRHGGAMTLEEGPGPGAHLVITLPQRRGAVHE
ncbi:MAG: HAMP domain-containing protein [Candidatus Aminicenantes bacterium]|nr:HAMP domain-containing protein [Candidatus Aminicenantes bacterium]